MNYFKSVSFLFVALPSMLYYKFIGVKDREPNERYVCGGKVCPTFRVYFSGNVSGSGDCRQTLYGSRLSDLPPALKNSTETFKANGDPVPPEGWGAGSQRPFDSRKPVNGKYSSWSEWGACSTTCGPGTQYKTRECNNPIPMHGGRNCANVRIKSRNCNLENCEV